MTAQPDHIPFVDISVRMDSLVADVFQIVQKLFPSTRPEDWLLEELQGELNSFGSFCFQVENIRISPKQAVS